MQAVEASLLIGLFQSGKDTHIKRHLVGNQVPNNSRYLVGHGRDGFGCTQFGPQASIFISQVAFIIMQRTGCHPQGLSNPILTATRTAVKQLARAGFIIRTQAQPGAKVLCSFKGTQVIA